MTPRLVGSRTRARRAWTDRPRVAPPCVALRYCQWDSVDASFEHQHAVEDEPAEVRVRSGDRGVRDAGTFVRARVQLPGRDLELDLVHDAVADVEPPPAPIEGVVVESLADLRAAKLTCILSRSEPRDLVALLCLDRAGFPPEEDMTLAFRKDGGIDPGVLAWLLGQFPVRPLPMRLEPWAAATDESMAGNPCRVVREIGG
jgi:hypothetical protein